MNAFVILSEAKDLRALQWGRRFLAALGMTIVAHALFHPVRYGPAAGLTPET